MRKKAKNNKTFPNKLHLGCGLNKRPGFLGVDINPQTNANIIHDLNIFPYPFKNNQFKVVVAEHILEHLQNVQKVMEEIYRISKPGGYLYILAPHFSSMDNFTDPTHLHSFTSMSLDYFIPGTLLYNFRYSALKYKKLNVKVGDINSSNLFLKTFLYFINKHLILYEKRLAFIFPVGIIQFELEVIK